MTLYSIDKLLNVILSQPQWEKQRKFHELTKCWYQVVNHKVAQHARPVSFSNEVLYIATISSAWAQDLNLQRRSLIVKINRRMDSPIEDLDLHFASVKWYQNKTISVDREDDSNEHPSIIISDSLLNLLPPDNPEEALQKWFNTIKKRANQFTICPLCNTHCPEGELKRWGFCAMCFQKQASNS
ncbi:DUF721 domain-containing protein [Geminocystis sp. NIES-3709]|uniref:DUF721 domain-containing protein n=1 Tax=Geminocystis sp. NIES-3709 TaxID=1617448 RepID=UPI0005FCCD44|nr:DUF721 domain-containing protein [Geminocystis sp. NIES-3709]BAQ64534.1 Zn-ribbon-containing [Geminocystis sp. NIES-3709]